MNLTDEFSLNNRLINSLLIIFAVISPLMLILTQARALDIGFTTRDIIQILAVLSVIILSFFRKKIDLRLKAIILISINITVGVTGLFTLGPMATGIFPLLISAVIMSLLFSKRAAVSFGVIIILLIVAIAFGYISGAIILQHGTDELLNSYSNWSVYVTGISLFILIATYAIFNYRQAMKTLLTATQKQRDELKKNNRELKNALDEVRTLRGIIPICSYCKRIRDDKDAWNQIEFYVSQHTEAEFSHGICPECLKKQHAEDYDAIMMQQKSD